MKAILLTPFRFIKHVSMTIWKAWKACDNPQMEAITIAFGFFAGGLAFLGLIYVVAHFTNPARSPVQTPVHTLASPAHYGAPSYQANYGAYFAPSPTVDTVPLAQSTHAFGRPRTHHYELVPPGRADALTQDVWR